MKRDFSEVTLQEAMQRIGQENILRWQMNVPSRQPSEGLRQRWQSFRYSGGALRSRWSRGTLTPSC